VCFVLHLRTGRLEQKHRSYRLLDEAFKTRALNETEQGVLFVVVVVVVCVFWRVTQKNKAEAKKEDASDELAESESAQKKMKKKNSAKKASLRIAEYDYSDLSRAAFDSCCCFLIVLNGFFVCLVMFVGRLKKCCLPMKLRQCSDMMEFSK
jgi:hypothetical protein